MKKFSGDKKAEKTKQALYLCFPAILLFLGLCVPEKAFGFAVDTEIYGLVIDQTQTRVGAEFYRCFVLFWAPPREDHARDFTITITERASAQWGFWVWVQVNDTTLYQKVLKPQPDDYEDEARAAVRVAQRYLVTQRRGEQLTNGDLFGKGI